MRLPIQLAGLGLLCLYFFSVNESALYLPYDGAYMRQLVKFNFEWSNPTTGLVFGPLQGIGSVSFPVNYWFSPATLVSYGLNGATIDPVLVYSFTTLELFASLWMLSNAVGASRGVQMASSWLGSVLVMPFIVPPYVNSITFYPISGLIPWVVEHLALSILIMALVLRLRSANSLTAVVVIALVTIIGCWSTVAFPLSIVLNAPVIVLVLAVILLSRNRSLPSVATNVALCLVAVGVAIGPMLFVLGLLLHSVPGFFNRELVYGRPDWIFISILFHGPHNLGWASSVVFLLGLMGGLFASFKAGGDFRLVARVYVGYSILLLTAGIVLTFIVTSYRGPSMLYFEWFVWPLMFIYAAYFVAQIIRFATSRVFQRRSPSPEMVRTVIAAAPVPPLVPIVVGLALLTYQ